MPSVNKVIYGNQTLIDLTDATASADTILEGYTAYGANGQKITGTATAGGAIIIRDEQDVGGGTIRYITASSAYYLQNSKEVTPTKSVQNVTPDTGYDAFETVKVNPIPNEYIVPSGTSNITENGTYGISNYASVAVNVQPDLSSLTVTPTESAQAFPPSGFLYDGYSTVNVGAIPSTYVQPTGTLTISANGTYDVTEYASASINVAGGAGELTADDIAMRYTFSGEISGMASYISMYAFSNFMNLKAANFPSCSSIGSSAFENCIKLSSISFPVCKSINFAAFYSCTSLTIADFTLCETIGGSAFAMCSLLTAVNFPSCSSIGSNAFLNCWKLSSISFPACTLINAYAFASCSLLTAVNFPSCSSIGSNAFYGCWKLSSISFPVCTLISIYAFRYNSSLTIINFPSCGIIKESAFAYCGSLNTAYFPVCSLIYSYAFRNCYNLLSLYILSTSLCSLSNINAFTSTPISNYTASTGGVYGSIFVRASLYNSYLTATNWSYFSSRFASLTDAEIEALGF